MKVVYIAGPFRAPTQWGIAENVRAAERWGKVVGEMGAMPMIPHANTAHFHGLMTEEFWIEGTKELLRRCDAILMIPGWEKSTGARGEKAEAERLGLPVFVAIEEHPQHRHLFYGGDSFANWISGQLVLGRTNTTCSVCGEMQWTSPSGVTCKNGHGGAPPAD